MISPNTLTQPIKVGSVVLKNRIVMPPMDTNFAGMDGSLSRKHYAYLTERARGGAGLIIVEASSVSFPLGKISERQIRMNTAEVTADWHDVTDSVHAFGAKIVIQLHHGGFMAIPAYCGGVQSVSASDYGDARAMNVEEVKAVIQDFVNAARIAQDCGFDGVEIHAAHMYLINQFLSPLCNTRTDEYGGSLEKRFRILREILQGIRTACSPHLLVSVRLGVLDHPAGGTTLEDGVRYAQWCEACGADMINVSCGFYSKMNHSTESQWDPEGSRLFMSAAVKKAVSIPVAIVGKLRDPGLCATAIKEGKADLVCIGRQLICDPAWPNKVLTGRLDRIRPCLNCNEGCVEQFYFRHGNVHCAMNPYVGYEDMYSESSVSMTGVPRRIAVVGGGIAGMQFAITAKRRGHDITILEKSDKLGGQAILAGVPPFKKELQAALTWFRHEVARLGVPVHMNSEATAEQLSSSGADCVVLATGSKPAMPSIPGIEHAVNAWSILDGSELIPEKQHIVIIGGGVVGAELAHLLAEHGCAVTILEMLPVLCSGHETMHKGELETYLNAGCVIHLKARVMEIRKNGVVFFAGNSQKHTIEADRIIYATGQRAAGDNLYDELCRRGMETYRIGDCNRPSNIRFATRSALELAYRL